MPPMGPPGRRNDFKKPKNAKKTFTRILKYMGKNKLFLILVFLMLFFLIYDLLLSWHFYHDIRFYFIFFFDIVESVKYKTTFVSCFYFFNIIFKSL